MTKIKTLLKVYLIMFTQQIKILTKDYYYYFVEESILISLIIYSQFLN